MVEGYGQTEVGVISMNNPLNGDYKIGSVGKPIMDAKITDGILWVKPDKTWINTHDNAHLDGNGFLHILGREKEDER
jgi:long-subunit acyl-CoA synthetase (AMP-forming)